MRKYKREKENILFLDQIDIYTTYKNKYNIL